MYSFMWVIMMFALIYAFHFATKYHLIDDLSGYADPNTLAENCRQRQRTYALYPKRVPQAKPTQEEEIVRF